MKVAIVATHPIQYQVPWYRALASREDVDLTVYYALLPDAEQQGIGFGVPFSWDLRLLDGYNWEALPNSSKSESLDGFFANRTPEVGRILAKARPDAIVITGWHAWPLVQAVRAARRLGIPTVVRGESNALRPRPWWARVAHRQLLARFDAFLAIGKSNREFYLRNGVRPERIFEAPYFVDNDWFRTQHERYRGRRDEIRFAWEIHPEATCVLYAGKLISKKRVLDLVRACGVARRSRAKIHLLVVGDGEEREEVEGLTAELGIPVAFTGFLNQTEIGRAYVAADCLVLPSDYGETWGLVVNEGMVNGLPAIVSDRVGCQPDLIVKDLTGWTFPFGEVEALAERITWVAKHPVERRRAGERARHHVELSYSVERAVEGTVAAIEFVLGGKRGADGGGTT